MRTVDVVTDGYLCSPLSVSVSGYFCLLGGEIVEKWKEVVYFALSIFRKVDFNSEL